MSDRVTDAWCDGLNSSQKMKWIKLTIRKIFIFPATYFTPCQSFPINLSATETNNFSSQVDTEILATTMDMVSVKRRFS